MNTIIVLSFLFALIIPIMALVCILVVENLQYGLDLDAEQDAQTPPQAHQTQEIVAV